MRTISLKLPQRLIEQVETRAKDRRISKSEVIRESLETSFRTPGSKVTCFDLSADLVGIFDGLPEDLATDHKYMEGFGE
ncbi:MAG: CopG family transcriptional regulator [Bryobacteraceae bacterium]|nr:CopG family transcriptional regulator [Bryobacteraceae bacterium]